jgi:hypothetical protein
MRLQRMKTLAVLGVLTLLLAIAVGPASAALINLTPTNGVNSNTSVPLSDLVSGQAMGLQVGDKIFTGFNYSRIGDMPMAQNILVLGFRDPDGNWGVSFHGAFGDLPGGGASDALIRYIVDVAPEQAQQGIRISDAHLFLGGVGVGQNSFFTVDESFLGLNNTLHAVRTSLDGGVNQLHDVTFFDPLQSRLFVAKDILAFAANTANQPARATIIDQSYSQTIPEPAAIALATVGLALCGLVRRRRTR